jgi:hypothetical protein
MGYIVPAGFSRVSFKYNAVSSMGSQIVFGFGVNEGPTEHLLSLLEQWWNESLKLRTNVGYRLTSIEARNDVEVLERPIGSAGLLAGEPAPPNTCALGTLGTGLVGRKYRGRVFLPGVLLDGDVEGDGSIDPGARTSIGGVLAYLIDVLEADGVHVYILHSDVGAPTLVTTFGVSSQCATQRRRMRR